MALPINNDKIKLIILEKKKEEAKMNPSKHRMSQQSTVNGAMASQMMGMASGNAPNAKNMGANQ